MLKPYFKIEYNNKDITRDVSNYVTNIEYTDFESGESDEMLDVGEQVACLMDENSEDGIILGSIYTSLDNIPAISNNKHLIKFEDGSFIEYNKESQMLTIVVKTLNVIADIINTGKFENTDGIVSNSDVSDRVSTMQAMRDIYNAHTHVGNLNLPTSAPNGSMQ